MGGLPQLAHAPWQLLFRSTPVLMSSCAELSQTGGASSLCKMDEYCFSSCPTGTALCSLQASKSTEPSAPHMPPACHVGLSALHLS